MRRVIGEVALGLGLIFDELHKLLEDEDFSLLILDLLLEILLTADGGLTVQPPQVGGH